MQDLDVVLVVGLGRRWTARSPVAQLLVRGLFRPTRGFLAKKLSHAVESYRLGQQTEVTASAEWGAPLRSAEANLFEGQIQLLQSLEVKASSYLAKDATKGAFVPFVV